MANNGNAVLFQGDPATASARGKVAAALRWCGQQAGLGESGSRLRAVHGACGTLECGSLAAALRQGSSLLLGLGGARKVLTLVARSGSAFEGGFKLDALAGDQAVGLDAQAGLFPPGFDGEKTTLTGQQTL
jgi:hypothetical protein